MSDETSNEVNDEMGGQPLYLGVVFWWNPGLRKGVLADVEGTTYVFRDAATPHDDYIRSPVFPDGWQPITRPGKPSEGDHASWIVTKTTIVEFGIEYFSFREDGAQGSQILSVAPAEDYSQQDYETLITIREKYDAQKAAERKARYEAANPGEGNRGPRTRRYSQSSVKLYPRPTAFKSFVRALPSSQVDDQLAIDRSVPWDLHRHPACCVMEVGHRATSRH